MTSHELARRLIELPDAPVDVDSVSVLLRHPGGDTSVVSDVAFQVDHSDANEPGEPVAVESIILHPYPTEA